jgi:hypothetical protein
MTNSATSTEPAGDRGAAIYQPWHFYMLLSLVAATVAVVVTKQTHPAALLLLSGAILGAGAAAVALHYALSGFFGARPRMTELPLAGRSREAIEREKALVLRSLKELEFDRAMRKIGDADFAEIGGRLRARALVLMQELERPDITARAPVPGPDDRRASGAEGGTRPLVAGAAADPAAPTIPALPSPGLFADDTGNTRVFCSSCDTPNEPDARFCKACGARLLS